MFKIIRNWLSYTNTADTRTSTADTEFKRLWEETHAFGSASNNGSYPQFCMKAAVDDSTFNTFKQSPIYTKILEHVTKEMGERYVERIKELDENLLSDEYLEIFRKNDEFGGAILEDCLHVKKISPSTLRYISVLAEIKNIFGSLDNKKVCEIGVGYGGQCRILTSFFNIKKYTLVDMYPVLKLSQKFLDHFAINSCIEYKTMNELDFAEKYDFVISNYAFSELNRELQTTYYNKIIKNSTSGYMVINLIGESMYKSYSQGEYLRLFPNVPSILPEIPNSWPTNYVVVWGKKLSSEK